MSKPVMDRKQLIKELEQAPEPLLSESSLKKDWLCAEEEAAWRNL